MTVVLLQGSECLIAKHDFAHSLDMQLLPILFYRKQFGFVRALINGFINGLDQCPFVEISLLAEEAGNVLNRILDAAQKTDNGFTQGQIGGRGKIVFRDKMGRA